MSGYVYELMYCAFSYVVPQYNCVCLACSKVILVSICFLHDVIEASHTNMLVRTGADRLDPTVTTASMEYWFRMKLPITQSARLHRVSCASEHL